MENIENPSLQQAESPNAMPFDTLSTDNLPTDNSTIDTLATDNLPDNTLPQVEKTTLKNASKIFSQISLALLFYLAVASLGQIITAFVAGMFSADIMQNKIAVPLFTFLPQYLLAFPLTLLLFRKIKYTPHPKTKLSVGNLLGFSAVSYGGMLITNIATLALVSLIMGLLSKTARNPLEALVSSSVPLLNILFVGIAAPIFEEILFRKFVIDRVAKYGELTAVIFSGIVFGLFHVNIFQFFYATLLGLIFAYVYVKTRNVIYPIIMHMIINLTGSVLPFAAQNEIGFFVVSLLIVAALIFGIVFFCKNIKKVNFQKGDIAIPNGKRFKTIFLNFGGIIFLVISISVAVVAFALMLV